MIWNPRGCRAVLLVIAVVLVSASAPVRGQSASATLSGLVRDETGAGVPDVRVVAANLSTGLQRQALTTADGAFTLRALPPGRYSVTAEREGFTPAHIPSIDLAAGQEMAITIDLTVAPFAEHLSVGSRREPIASVPPSTVELSPVEVRSVAGAGENIYHVLQTLPGIVPVNEFDSRLTVRGGGPDQNLTVMDGVEIHNPYRLFGLTSAFNPETVESFELTAGGFSAKYGDRLSSILIIENRAGSQQARLMGSSAMSLTDGNLVAEGRLPGGARGSWLVTGRRTYYDLIAERVVHEDLPSFADLQAKAIWEPRPGQRLSLFGLRSREGTDAEFDDGETGDRVAIESGTRNDLAAISFTSSIGSRASSKTLVSWYRNRERLAVDGDVKNESRRSNRPESDAVPFSNILLTRGLTVRDIAVREEIAIKASRTHLIESGFETHALTTDWGWEILGDRNTDEANGSSMAGGTGLPSLLDSHRSARRAGAWLIDRWSASSRLQIEPGVRIDWSGLAGEVTASPRVAASLDIGGGTRLRMAGGLFTQSPGYEKLLQSDYFVDLTDADALGLRSERAWHGLVGIERAFAPGLSLRAEGYYKRFDRLIVGRLETPDELAARVATYDSPSELAWSIPRAPRITSVPANDGEGRAYGIDFFLARHATSASDRLTGWISYAWGKAETSAYGRTYASDYDRRHAFSLVGSYRLSRLIELSTTIRVQSGFPYSPATGLRVAAVEDTADADGDGNVTELVPQRDAQGLLVWAADLGDVTNLSAGRLPLYARVDARVTFRPRWMHNRWQIYVEVLNVLNRDNAGSLEPHLAYDPSSDRPRLEVSREERLPLLPSFGVRYRF
jgi:Carboxypeptidase regulatory-like domain/TonB dependent receptor-like, beta-barrel/TonB-dependent Receptor Plug Domain